MSEINTAAGKAGLVSGLDLAHCTWHRLRPTGDTVEYAFLPHPGGGTYVGLRSSSDPDGTVLVFTPSEWDAFLAGIADGEFDV